MMSKTIKIRSDRFSRAASSWVGNSRRGAAIASGQQMRLFARDVVRITPPNQNYRLNKSAGEKKIRKELNGIMRVSRAPGAEDPATVHRQYRRGGRVYTNLRTGSRDRRHRVRDLRTYIAGVVAQVGLLASGWLPAAAALGLELPSWISRHGMGHGSYLNVETLNGRKIRIVNRVPFASSVRDLDRRVQHAADNRAIQMEKQTADYIFRQAARRAGFKVAA